MPTVFANGRSIVHAGDGQVNTSAPPDVCKTPSPGGPVPIPYVNVAKSSDLADGTKSVKIEGNSVAVESSNLSTSTGDEPGTAGGIISSKTKGKLTWQTRSLDVKFEGKGVVRFGDVTLHNGNSFNTAFMQNGGTGFAYGDDQAGNCPICKKSPKHHRVLETKDCSDELKKFMDALLVAHCDYAEKVSKLKKIIKDLNDREDFSIEAEIGLKAAQKAAQRAVRRSGGVGDSKLQADVGVWQKLHELYHAEFMDAGGEARQRAAKQEMDLLKPVLKRGDRGYMVGLMICCGGRKYAAMSGKSTLGFVDVVKKQNDWELCDASVKLEQAMASNNRITGNKVFSFSKRWSKSKKSFTRDPKRFNMPGHCAAQKLAVRAKPHKPGRPMGAMSEKWFSPVDRQKVVLVRYRGAPSHKEFLRQVKARFAQLSIPEHLNALVDDEGFSHDDTVPSCCTCQDVLPMLLCDLDSRCC